MLTVDEIRSAAQELGAQYGVEHIYLFGSYARGGATAESDVDLCVEAARLRGLFALSGLRMDLEEALDKDLDLITVGSLRYNRDELFLERLRKERVLIYEIAG